MRVLLLDEDVDRAALVQRALRDAGHETLTCERPCPDLLEAVRRAAPDVVIVSVECPDRDMLEDLAEVGRHAPKPIVMFAQRSPTELVTQGIQAGVAAYVVDGLRGERVAPVLEVAVARFNACQEMRAELDQAKAQLADRKIIEQAKGILMRKRGCDEHEAYTALRKLAMDRNQRLAEVARSVIAAAKLLG